MSQSQTIDISNARNNIHKAFTLYEEAGKKTKPLMQGAARFMKTRIQLAFKTSTSPYGQKWAPLKSRDGQILRDTSRLLNSIGTKTTNDTAEAGTNVVYAGAHNEGVNKPVTVKAHIRLIRQAFGMELRSPVYVNVDNHTRKMDLPRRQFMPTPQQGMPPSWIKGIEKLFLNRLKKEGIING